jgi:hypothetical protein
MSLHVSKDFVGPIKAHNKVIGINLGFDLCYEHESGGIQGIRKGFGITGEGYGFEARKMTQLPEGLNYGKFKDTSYLILGSNLSKMPFVENGRCVWKPISPERRESKLGYIFDHDLLPVGEDHCDISAAWDNTGFAIRAVTSKYGPIMDAFEEAFLDNDVVIDGSSHLVKGFGLLIYSKIPESTKRKFEKDERNKRKIISP